MPAKKLKEFLDSHNVKYVMTFPFEFRNIQSCYPIFFQKDASSGKFFPLALFGFDDDVLPVRTIVVYRG